MLAMLNRSFRCVILHTVRLTNENQDFFFGEGMVGFNKIPFGFA